MRITKQSRQVRDIFLFSCFTGLAYIDAKRLKGADIFIGIDGEKWIYTRRKKTDSPTRIPLLPIVLEIMDNYKEHPKCLFDESLLPVPSNAKLNAYLKEIADICGIKAPHFSYCPPHICHNCHAKQWSAN